MATEKTQKNAKKYVCEPCHYNSCNKTDFMRHVNNVKHKNNTLATTCNNKNYICENCEKSYNDRTGLWKHRKTCRIQHKVPPEAQPIIQGTKLNVGSSDILIELVLEVIKQSKEVQNVLIEQNKELQKQLLEHSNKLLEKLK
uniref:C2H2-type domain-containing protein n=1 Tax=viral metagenome TaxID=1070528 RepID=A0A6C0HAP1_9ZZZZ